MFFFLQSLALDSESVVVHRGAELVCPEGEAGEGGGDEEAGRLLEIQTAKPAGRNLSLSFLRFHPLSQQVLLVKHRCRYHFKA